MRAALDKKEPCYCQNKTKTENRKTRKTSQLPKNPKTNQNLNKQPYRTADNPIRPSEPRYANAGISTCIDYKGANQHRSIHFHVRSGLRRTLEKVRNPARYGRQKTQRSTKRKPVPNAVSAQKPSKEFVPEASSEAGMWGVT